MLKNRIEALRQELYTLITENASYDKIYSLSLELDLLISEYYHLNGVSA